MGMNQKLEKAYQEGFQDGQKEVNDVLVRAARNAGIIQGAQETWEIIEGMIPLLPGIGPKTTRKIMQGIQDFARREKAQLERARKYER